MKKKTLSEGEQVVIAGVMFIALIAALVWYGRWMAERKAESLSRLSGAEVTAEDVILGTDSSIRVYRKGDDR